MKRLIMNVEETVTFVSELMVSNKDYEACCDGEMSDEDILEKYEEKADKAKVKIRYDENVVDGWIELEDGE